MAYIGANLSVTSQTIEGGFNVAVYYSGADSVATVAATNYFSDGQQRGLKNGDIVYVIVGTTAATYVTTICEVTALQTVTSGYGATVAAIAASSLGTGSSAVNTAISTAGAGSLTAAGLVGGVITRTGPVAAFTDTTVTATALLAAVTNKTVGNSWIVRIINQTAYPETIAGGSGVTISGSSIVAPLSWSEFLVTYNASTPTFTMYGMASGSIVAQPPAVFNTAALESATITAASVTGAGTVHFINTGTTPANLQLPAAADIILAIPNAKIGYAYTLLVRNGSGSANTATLTTNTGLTLTGTMTIAQNVTRTFVVTYTGAGTVTVQSMGISAAAA